MPKKPEAASPCTPRLTMYKAKQGMLFERINSIYNLSKGAETSEETRELFLNSCITIGEIRSSFHKVLDDYNKALLETDPEATPSYQSYTAFEDLYCHIKQVMSRIKPAPAPASETSSPSKSKPKLPVIELMSFDGDIKNWPLFYASFNATVHENNSLSDADKLYYLIGKLSPTAQATFAGIIPSAENYQIIYQALLDKYQDVRLLGSNYLEQALGLKLSSTPSASNYQLFIDQFVVAINSLKALKIDDLLDFVLVHIAMKKFDTETLRAFQMHFRDKKFPTLNEFIDFIKTQCRIFESTQPACSAANNINNNPKSTRKPTAATRAPNPQSYVSSSSSDKSCPLCKHASHDHYYKCIAFEKLSPTERFKFIKNNNACVNCTSRLHKSVNCLSKLKCRVCSKPHHSMLHFNNNKPQSEFDKVTSATAANPAMGPCQSQMAHRTDLSLCSTRASVHAALPVRSDIPSEGQQRVNSCETVLLATAQVIVYDAKNRPQLVRCLLDSASQSNFITFDCCMRLGLLDHMKPTHIVVKGIGGSEKPVKGAVNVKIYSQFNPNIYFDLGSLVIDRISDTLPSAKIDSNAFAHLASLPLADKDFATPGPVDCLVGASTFSHLLLPGVVHSNYSNVPPAIQTVLGFVIMGSAPTSQPQFVYNNVSTLCCSVVHNPMDTLLKRFWELEEIPAPPTQSPDDFECEQHFRATTVREDGGRYVVALPFRSDVCLLGDSYAAVLGRLRCLERKLEASLKTRAAYNDVIRDYISTGYLSPVKIDKDVDDVTRPTYTIPHHGVVREDKSSTKLRCVLDASCKSSSGYSLNDLLHAGANLQGDLFSILINFRLFKVTLSADCRQMFLQIVVREPDRRFQRILYRFSTDDPVTVFEFNRVCFGLKSSPFHALRVIRQLIADEGNKFPAAAAAASSFLYMDDIVLSVMTDTQAISLSDELIQLFKLGQFDLVKWTSNSDTVLGHIPDTHKESHDKMFDETVPHKILGLYWDRSSDCFRFVVAAPDDKCTKRTILSAIARLWDIMGFVAPAILYAKLLIKELWLSKCDWDDEPPRHIVNNWTQFCQELHLLNKLCIPRHLGIVQDCVVNVIGFADASERAYGGVVYLQIQVCHDCTVQLVCAKSKVSPVKVVSVARLELCAAVLLSQLLRKVLDITTPRYAVNNVFAFSDSKVVLCWINASPHRWQTFVANRVVKLTENIPASRFFHVSGSENPADCLSRGLSPGKLINHPLWFVGPPWITRDSSEWPVSEFVNDNYTDAPEQRTQAHVLTTSPEDSPLYVLAQRFSSYSKLLRAIVYIYRFMKILPRGHFISAADLEFAENKLIRAVQDVYFSHDKSNLIKNENCSPALNKLRPFLDENGIIRVGGRLSNSAEEYTHKHPYMLPRRDHVVDLIVDHYHRKHLHAGPELLMSLLRHRFWILAARRIIRYRIHKCNVCFKSKPRPLFPLMADLPSHRVNQVDKAFTHVGCDYAGPLQYTPVRGRGVKSRKAWLCIFTCLTTRATHIEIATDLSTISFLNAFKRFLSRRGPVKCMYTDNGTCFVGTRSYLRDLYKFLDDLRPQLEVELSENRINWKFIPPSSPHWGGSWESMVKIIKTHLFKVIGQQIVSYEELLTILAQVEALVNSRPLTTLSSDPAEPSALTPAHFIQTVPLSSVPAPELRQTDLLERHNLIDSIVQSFWKRWRVEYLHQLQTRAKWNVPSVPIQEGSVVIVKTDNAPPFAWPLGVVEKAHPSKDGAIRVVTIKTSRGSYLRPVVKLCPLPTQ